MPCLCCRHSLPVSVGGGGKIQPGPAGHPGVHPGGHPGVPSASALQSNLVNTIGQLTSSSPMALSVVDARPGEPGCQHLPYHNHHMHGGAHPTSTPVHCMQGHAPPGQGPQVTNSPPPKVPSQSTCTLSPPSIISLPDICSTFTCNRAKKVFIKVENLSISSRARKPLHFCL
jgi:hypothetical protein